MPYRFIALDIDHTLLNEAGHITPRVRQAIAAAIERGVHVTLATGRRLFSARMVAAELGVQLPIILYHGALIYDTASEAVLYQCPLSQELAGGLVAAAREYKLQPFLYINPAHDPHEFVYTGPAAEDDPFTEPYRASIQRRLRRTPSYHELGAVAPSLAIGILGKARPVMGFYRRLCGELACYTVLTPFMHEPGRMSLDLIHPSCSKASTLEHLAAQYGVPMAEVMAIGDGINDLEMLRAAGLGVAMGNAVPEVQACADAIVGTNEEDGVAEAIERWVLSTGSHDIFKQRMEKST